MVILKLFLFSRIHCFDNVNAIVFVVSLSEYDLTCYEDSVTPRMDESLTLFENICENKSFTKVPIILFFNKDDLFQEKIKKIDLSVWDREYEGGCDYEKALKHIRERFLKANHVLSRRIETFVCTTTEGNNFQKTFEQITSTSLEIFLKK
jgi:GTPase SAR1 family protein